MCAEGVGSYFSCSLDFRDGSRAEVRLIGELDNDTVAEARSALERIVRLRCRELVLDVSDLEFVGASGVGLIATVAAQLAESGGRVQVVGASPLVVRLASITGLDQVVTLSPAHDMA